MLKNYEFELQVLSAENIETVTIEKISTDIKTKLPSTDKKKDEILRYATDLILKNIKEENYDTCLGLARFIFISGFTNPMGELRKQGAFRISKVKFKTDIIDKIIKKIHELNYLTADDERYIRNVNTLRLLAPSLQETRKEILAATDASPLFLKTLLTVAEMKYCDLLWEYREFDNYYDQIFHQNKESILASASYIVQLLREDKVNGGIKYRNHVDEDYFPNYLFIIESGFSLINYLKSEIDVDIYDFDAITDENKNTVLVSNEGFESARDHGYAKTKLRTDAQLQRYSEVFDLKKSYIKFLDEIWLTAEKKNDNFFYFIKQDPERIIVNSLLMEYGHHLNIFGSDVLFSEEDISLRLLMDENYNEQAPFVKICGEFNSFDIFKLQRFFIYIGFIYRKAAGKLGDIGNKDVERIRMRSAIPVMEEAEILNLFAKTTGKSVEACMTLLKKLTNGPVIDGEAIDMQYKPIFKIENKYLILPTVFGHSNIIRSLAKSENVHFSVFGKLDHMVKSVSDALESQGFQVKRDFYFGVDEVDIVATMGEHLFLFECKNPYHPVNEFELRNTHSHLIKGFNQLENFKNRFQDKSTFDQFLKNIFVSPDSIKHVSYGVINANRALSGWRKDGIKVFHAGEFINLILTGQITLMDDRFSTWKGDKFCVDDLIGYMSGIIISDDLLNHKIMIRYAIPFPFGDNVLQLQSFEFDLNNSLNLQKQKYRLMGSE